MADQLGGEFDFRIVTTDRDLGDRAPYPGVSTNQWIKVGNASVYYMSPGARGLRKIARLMAETPHDLQYLNSFFDPSFTLKPLMARYMGLAPKKPLIIAPRGEFSPGALALKRWKKRPYVAVLKQSQILDHITWQASSEREAVDIFRVMNSKSRIVKPRHVKIVTGFDEDVSEDTFSEFGLNIHIAPDLPGNEQGAGPASMRVPRLAGQALRVCFLSRIAPMKNLDYALRVLAQVREPVRFSICGPQEDASYWLECQKLIDALPVNITVDVRGSVEHQHVVATLAQNDLFFLPTRGENFGHVIHEALRAGTPVLISDQTPWNQLEERAVGWALPLAEPAAFARVIEEVARWDAKNAYAAAKRAAAYATEMGSGNDARQANSRIFHNALAEEPEVGVA
jgi:glycosyltransferase involved in cell wall biosynthesis